MAKSYFAFCTFSLALLAAHSAIAQEFPAKPIRILSSPVGGGGDFSARLIAQNLAANRGWSVIVDNRAGIIPQLTEKTASPDGYTLLLLSGSLWIGPLMTDDSPIDAVKDYSPITITDRTPGIVVVHPSVAVNSVKELIALAKAKPGTLNYATGASGSSSHLTAELFKYMAGINIVRVPYKGAGPAVTGVVANEVPLMFATSSSVAAHIKSARLKALAITSAQPSPLFPGLPTAASTGLPGYESVTVNGMFAPARTPTPIINRLHKEIVQVLSQPEVKEKYFNIGVDAVGSSPQELALKIKTEIVTLGKVINEAGIRAE
jgi:tripartite-type tricarboxylate transporter receptor subunit TctC